MRRILFAISVVAITLPLAAQGPSGIAAQSKGGAKASGASIAPASTVIQDALDTASHVHPAPVAILTVFNPP